MPKPNLRPRAPAILLRPDGQAAGLVGGGAGGGLPRPLASLQAGQGEAGRGAGSQPRDPRPAGGLPDRHRPGLRYRRRRDGALVAAGRPRRRCAGLGGLRQGLGQRYRPAAEARGSPQARGALWPPARSRRRRFQPRRGLRLERHHLGRARARTAKWIPEAHDGLGHLRCDLGGLRHGAALGEARCRHLVLAEGAGGRRRPWPDRAEPAGGGAAGIPSARLALAEDLPAHQPRGS